MSKKTREHTNFCIQQHNARLQAIQDWNKKVSTWKEHGGTVVYVSEMVVEFHTAQGVLTETVMF